MPMMALMNMMTVVPLLALVTAMFMVACDVFDGLDDYGVHYGFDYCDVCGVHDNLDFCNVHDVCDDRDDNYFRYVHKLS
jgi:hypothetical protein